MQINKKSIISIASIFLVSLVLWLTTQPDQPSPVTSRLLQSYLTSDTRMVINQKLCKGVERNSFVSSSDISLKEQYMSHFNISFQVDGNAFYYQLSNDWSKAPDMLKEQVKGFILFAGPFALGFVVLLIFSPFLGCCCCCPNSCPSQCCRKDEDELYSKCELKCPSAFAILALGIAIGAGAFGLIKADTISKTLDSTACSLAVVPDDLLNGNVTSNNAAFFTGLNMLSQSLTWFDGNLTTINTILTNFDSNNTNMTTALSNGNALMNNIKDTDGNTGNGMTAINYGPPIGQSSTFPSILGTYNTTGLIFTYYSIVSGIVDGLNSLALNVQTYFNTSATISASIAAAQSNISSLISQVNNIDTQFQKYPQIDKYKDNSSLYVQLFQAFIIALSALGIFGALLMCCCDKHKCRYLMYFSCFFLTIVSILGLLLSTIISLGLPPMQWGCQFLNNSLSSRVQFSRNFRGLDSTTLNYVATCMPFSDGNIIAQFSPNLDSLNNLTSVFSYLETVNFAALNTSITDGRDAYLNAVHSYGSSQSSQISSSAQSTLASYADAANYPTCTDPNFALDSYVPSNNQNPVYVSCTTTGNNAGATECSGNFNPKGGSCFGCLDTTSIFANYANGAAVTTDIQGRYGNNAGCNAFATDISNVWTNYYNPKLTAIGSSFKSVGVYNAVNTLDITTFQGDLSTLDGSLSGVNATINSLNSLLDTRYGMLGGLNCRLFGEDFQNIVDTSCVLGFNSLFEIRLALGICSLGLFFASFCVVCAGSRFARQSERRSEKEEMHDDKAYEQKKKVNPRRPTYHPEYTLESMYRPELQYR